MPIELFRPIPKDTIQQALNDDEVVFHLDPETPVVYEGSASTGDSAVILREHDTMFGIYVTHDSIVGTTCFTVINEQNTPVFEGKVDARRGCKVYLGAQYIDIDDLDSSIQVLLTPVHIRQSHEETDVRVSGCG